MKSFEDRSASLTRRAWLHYIGLGATAAGCRGVLGAAGTTTVPAQQLTEVQREGVRAMINDAIAQKRIPGGSLVLLSRGQVVFREGFGRAELDSERPFSVDAPCFIASVTKPISATFFVMLDERGVVRLDDPVEKYLPEFAGIRVQGKGAATTTMRVWHLLSHRSGLPGNADTGEARPQRVARAAVEAGASAGDFSLAETISAWVKDGLLAEPGARFAYGSSGYMVAARIAEVVMGQRYERLLQEALIEPVGMRHTTFHPDAAILSQLPARYQSTATGLQRDTRTMPLPQPDGLINPAGGLCSRLDDLAAFLALHLNGGTAAGKRIVQADSLARMYRPHPPRATETADGGGIGYGLGWNAMAAGGVARHLGASGTVVWLDMKQQHAGALLTQVKWGPGNRPLIPRLMKEVQGIFGQRG